MANKQTAITMFPFKYDPETDSLARTVTVEDTLLSAIRLFLITKRGSRVGSNVGSFLPELKLQTIPLSQLPSLADELKSELSLNFPGVQFLGVEFSRDFNSNVVELAVKITFTSAGQSNITELTIQLPSIFDGSNSINFQRSL